MSFVVVLAIVFGLGCTIFLLGTEAQVSSLEHVKGINAHIQCLKHRTYINTPDIRLRIPLGGLMWWFKVYLLVLYAWIFTLRFKSQASSLNHVYALRSYTQVYFVQFPHYPYYKAIVLCIWIHMAGVLTLYVFIYIIQWIPLPYVFIWIQTLWLCIH